MGRPPRSNAFVVLMAAGATFVGIALVAGGATAVPKRHNPYSKLNLFTRVLSYVESSYVEEVDADELIYGAIKGMLETLDPHTALLRPEQYREMKGEAAGQFGGIGIEVDVRDGVVTVLSVMEGTPAQRAGLQPGDQILRIDDQPVRSTVESVQRMRGRKGTSVRLLVLRKGCKEPQLFSLVRENIKIRSVEAFALEPGLGVVRIRQFANNVHRDLETALRELEQGAPGGKLRGLILDLRNNPGGLLDEAVRVADAFLDSGLIVRTEGRAGRILDEERAHQKGTRLGFPIICLVNGGSASAAEIVAGALQDHGRAVIMGTQTFGKGSVQTVIELEDGGALKLTIARYYTPSGRSIQEKGITPDIIVDQVRMSEAKPVGDEPTQKERDLQGHLRNPRPEDPRGAPPPGYSAIAQHAPGGEDHQLRTAYDYLKSWNLFAAQTVFGQPAVAGRPRLGRDRQARASQPAAPSQAIIR
ncbi:MAG: S41 family peptidase [Myxococcales bacterium]|nr:S41 family peptidase [Myxococcota bacterium]MDW8281624.1 S41 family peptidase [Myxococcales bacterium]